MKEVLLITAGKKSEDAFLLLLHSAGCDNVLVANNGGEARRILAQNDFNMVVINTPLNDEYGHEIAMAAAAVTTAGIIVVTKSENADQISHILNEYGALVIPKPISKQTFFDSVRLSIAASKRVLLLKRENEKLKASIKELKLINKAKCCLIENKGFTENDAHKFIEKSAMDKRLTRCDVAEKILMQFNL